VSTQPIVHPLWFQQSLDESLAVADRQIQTLMLFDRQWLGSSQADVG